LLSGIDPATGAKLNLTPEERGRYFGCGSAQVLLWAGAPAIFKAGSAAARGRFAGGLTLPALTVRPSVGGIPLVASPAASPAGGVIGVPTVVLMSAEGPQGRSERSLYRIGRRKRFPSKKQAYEEAKKAGKGKEPIHHPHGEYGPHYHPNVPMPRPDEVTPKTPLPHDHYYYPKSQL